MDNSLFLDVFPGIELDSLARDYFKDVTVSKMVMYQGKKQLAVHIVSAHLISKEIIYRVEECIKKFVFGDSKNTMVIIYEKYNLSGQYNVEKLTHIYTDSFLCEIQNISKIDYRLLKRAKWNVNDTDIIIDIDDTSLAHEHAKNIKKYLEETYRDRFGMGVVVSFNYIPKDNSNYREESQHKLDQEIDAIVNNVKTINGTINNDKSDDDATFDEHLKDIDNQIAAAEEAEKNKNVVKLDRSQSKASNEKSGKGQNAQSGKYGRKEYSKRHISEDIDCFYGKNCEGDITPIKELVDGMGEVCIKGELLGYEERELRTGKFLITCNLTDYEDTIAFKLFVQPDDKEPILDDLKKGNHYKLKGIPAYDSYAKEVNITSVTGIKKIPDFREKRMDYSLEKRVELHLHTVMSEMDSVVDIEKVIKRAKEWGHKAIAITDHGGVQAFTIASHCIKLSEDFKIIYGVEGYFVDDLKDLVINDKGQDFDTEYVVFDIETTGLSAKHNKIIEIGAVKIDKNGNEIDRFSEFVNPQVPIPYNIEKLTSINDEMVMGAPTIDVILPKFMEFCKGTVLVAHNAAFDTGFIREFCKQLGIVYDCTALDTMTLAQIFIPELGKFTLDRLCKHFNFKNEHHHRACDDADVTAKIFIKLLDMIKIKGCETLSDLNTLGADSSEIIKKGRMYHGIILVKNEIGRVNLYRLISESHINYFNRRPRMPMSLINKYREGLIIGSACEAGELFRAVLNDASDEEITRIVKYFDYLEIQPIGNDMFMIEKEDNPVTCVEDIQNINKKICELGETFNKPVVATCDVHFLDPEDSIYRAIIMNGKGFADADRQPPLYYRTTEEMLNEFQYLGSDKAREVVITNTNLICDMIDKISPVRPDKCPPIIENSDELLRSICYDKAHEIYGPNLPSMVSDRLERELHSIITNGFAVMYIIAQKLVWKSNEDGYLVGSRGSVGSSFVATMSGITEVNPLPAHYICPECHFVDFDSELVKSFTGMSGCDMPDCNCPKCGTKMIKEGHDIPFETFLGFNGDKEPDIDLNFSGDYQPRAHAYTEELFGKGKAFRAGTIGTLAEKTAYGYVLKYYEERGISKRRAEIERLALGCTGAKRTTGQHPGGMIVLPKKEEIYSFTPIQKPANDMTTNITTTHFEYHSIDHNLLKLDILGHDDPTMIRRIEDLTNFDAHDVPLDDKKVMSLFHGTEALGITPADIDNVPLGTLGVPEFGTDFAMQMVIDANPQSFSDLVRISGLAHGTDVWLGNAKDLIEQGVCALSSAICCRDDIMIYLISMGLDKGVSFKIMESVRKGKGLSEEWKKIMLEHGVPDWYISSCLKIKYMFPKAHAAAYDMMAWRIAYYKIYYPLAYYTAFFGIRASAFSYELMCLGREKLDIHLTELRKMDKNDQTAKIQDTIRDMRIVQEMYARGIEFMPINIYKADDKKFQIIDGKIMPSLASIDGMGEKAATQLKEAAAEGVFLSQEEIKNRAKVSSTVVEKMAELGILGDLPATSQLTFVFD